jgi:hypothetical protein
MAMKHTMMVKAATLQQCFSFAWRNLAAVCTSHCSQWTCGSGCAEVEVAWEEACR